ncbi:MAG: hypothetical protein LBN30_05745 [Oscillospiraceae bacterium]|jgi:hypothetical protein|nr:hypothetical protein [Oscillospiraceae bacterium]
MMKTIKKVSILVLTLAILVTAASCAKVMQGNIQTGTWADDGKTFTNEWANLKLVLPEGYTRLSSEEIAQSVGAGDDVVIGSGVDKTALDVAKMRTAYDLMVIKGDGLPNAILMYENIALTPAFKGLDEKGYYNALAEQMAGIADFAFEDLGVSTKTFAGETYTVGKGSMLGGLMFQEYYLRKLDGVIIALCVTYSEDTQADADALIAAFVKAK